jgi:hypothetical protein
VLRAATEAAKASVGLWLGQVWAGEAKRRVIAELALDVGQKRRR